MALAYEPQQQEGPNQEEREAKLIRMLKSEEEDALGYAQTEVTDQQIEALKRYNAEAYGDEEEGRSQVCTRELYEAIQSTLPDLMRVFTAGGNVVSLEPTTEQDAKYTQDASDYLYFAFFNDNPGYQNLFAFAFDGLLQRRGYLAAYWCDKEYRAPQTLTGLNIMQVAELAADPQVEIIGQDFDQESEAGGITLAVRRTKSPAKLKIVVVAPEDMRFNGRRIGIDDGRYIGRVHRLMRGEAMRKWPNKAQALREYSGKGVSDGLGDRTDSVRAQRFNDNSDAFEPESNEMATELVILEEYLHVDLDDDGYPELIRSYRCGDLMLEESEVEENPFGSWTPIPIPHRFLGLSYHDILSDLQRQSTVLTRAGLDAVYQSVVNREAYDKNKVPLDELLATYSGAKIGVDGTPGDAIMPLTGGLDTAQTAWQALELVARRIEDRTGITRQARGLDAADLSKDHSGVALQKLQLYADSRKELIARNMADGLASFFAKCYRIICRNQNEGRQARVGGKWCVFDPRTWNSDLRCTVYSGGTNREHALMGLQLIAAEQEKVIDILGPGNPVVTTKNRFRYQEELCRLAGHKDASPFFTEVSDVPETDEQGAPVIDPQTGQPKMKPWAPEPQPSPEMAKVQADMQAQQAAHQLKAQEASANLQLQQQKDAAQLQSDAAEAELKLRLQQEKNDADIQLAREKAQAEIDLAWAKFEAEQALARTKLEAELQMQREQMAHDREMHREQISSDEAKHSEQVQADVKISKNRPGGDLSE